MLINIIKCIIFIIYIYSCQPDDIININNDINQAVIHYNNAIQLQTELSDNNNNKQDIITLYLQSIQLYPTFCQAHQNLACIYESVGDITYAIYYHNMSILYADTDIFKIGAIANLINIYLNTNMIQYEPYKNNSYYNILELESLMSTYNIYPPNAGFTLGNYYNYNGEYDKALVIFMTLYKENKYNINAIMNIGNYYFRKNDYIPTIYYYNLALDAINLAE